MESGMVMEGKLNVEFVNVILFVIKCEKIRKIWSTKKSVLKYVKHETLNCNSSFLVTVTVTYGHI